MYGLISNNVTNTPPMKRLLEKTILCIQKMLHCQQYYVQESTQCFSNWCKRYEKMVTKLKSSSSSL